MKCYACSRHRWDQPKIPQWKAGFQRQILKFLRPSCHLFHWTKSRFALDADAELFHHSGSIFYSVRFSSFVTISCFTLFGLAVASRFGRPGRRLAEGAVEGAVVGVEREDAGWCALAKKIPWSGRACGNRTSDTVWWDGTAKPCWNSLCLVFTTTPFFLLNSTSENSLGFLLLTHTQFPSGLCKEFWRFALSVAWLAHSCCFLCKLENAVCLKPVHRSR